MGIESTVVQYHEDGTLKKLLRGTDDLSLDLYSVLGKDDIIHTTDSQCERLLARPSKYSVDSEECRRLMALESRFSISSDECKELFGDDEQPHVEEVKEPGEETETKDPPPKK